MQVNRKQIHSQRFQCSLLNIWQVIGKNMPYNFSQATVVDKIKGSKFNLEYTM